MRPAALVMAAVALGGCTQTEPRVEPEPRTAVTGNQVTLPPTAEAPVPVGTPHTPGASAAPKGPFADRLLAIAREYRAWGRVDDELRWAPWLCRMPMPAEAHVSASADSATHGDKLYSLFAKDRRAYVTHASAPGQVLVKESWKPERVADPASAPTRWNSHAGEAASLEGDHFLPYARSSDGAVFRAAERAGLFVMFKLPRETPGTDEGWVYGTVTTRDEVTAAGRVESCMGCHKDAAHDRLFGVAREP